MSGGGAAGYGDLTAATGARRGRGRARLLGGRDHRNVVTEYHHSHPPEKCPSLFKLSPPERVTIALIGKCASDRSLGLESNAWGAVNRFGNFTTAVDHFTPRWRDTNAWRQLHDNENRSQEFAALRTVSTTGASNLSMTIQTDSNCDSTFEVTTSEVTIVNGDGSRTEPYRSKH